MGLDQNIYRKDSEGNNIEELYFRKVNFLHRYLTDCAINADEVDGDNCVEFIITRKDLDYLVDLCHEIMGLYFDEKAGCLGKDTQTWQEYAEEELPPMQGFFFGSYDLDEYYLSQVNYVAQRVSELLSKHTDEEFYYSAWY